MGLRRHLGYRANEVPSDVYSDFRRIGLHVFRRQLNNSGISGLFIDHPTVGRCVLVNYTEDVYRQRFTVAHEAGHAILDTEAQFVVSFARDERDFSEFRANAFASNYVIPREFITAIPDPATWDGRKLVEWAGKLKVSTAALAIALKDAGLISQAEVDALRSHRVPAPLKADPELPASLSPAVRARREDYLRRGLSVFYVDLCFRAYEAGVITAGRLAEMLLTTEADLHELARFAGRRLAYGS